MKRPIWFLALVLAGILPTAVVAQTADLKCAVPASIYGLAKPLPVSSAAVIAGKPLKVVAIGSSTTQGAGVDDPAGSYPARLEMELLRRLPGTNVQVVNQGVSGQLARQMVERFETDVIAQRPSLVVWQTGLNDVVGGVDVDDFSQTLRDGIRLLKEARIDVVIMDLQYYPNSNQFDDYDDYLEAMEKVAGETGVSVFHRFNAMRHVLKNLKRKSDSLMGSNLFAMMDLNYRCVPLLLAEAIFEKVHDALFTPGPVQAPKAEKK